MRRKDAKAYDKAQHERELKQITQAIRELLTRIEDAVPLISLAITASGASLSSTLPSTVSLHACYRLARSSQPETHNTVFQLQTSFRLAQPSHCQCICSSWVTLPGERGRCSKEHLERGHSQSGCQTQAGTHYCFVHFARYAPASGIIAMEWKRL